MKSDQQHYEALLHYNVAFIGGFFALYTVLSRAGLLGSAQTSNMLYMVRDLVGKNPLDFLIRIGSFFFYIAGFVLITWLPEHTNRDLKAISMWIDILVMLIIGFFPEDADPILSLYPVFFALAFQWCAFKGAYGYVSATIFSTNNLRQFTTAFTSYLMHKNPDMKIKMTFFGITLITYHVGAALAFLLWRIYSVRAIWFGMIPALGVLSLIALYQHQKLPVLKTLFFKKRLTPVHTS